MAIIKVSREDAIASNLKMEKERQKNIEIKENKPKIKIPKDTYLLIKNQTIDNFNLKLNKFAKFDEKKGYKLQNQNINEKIFYGKVWDDFFKDNIAKQEAVIQKLFGINYKKIELQISYRLVIGSEESIYETSIRLHHIYGIPFIPSSAIKGVVRSYIIQEKFNSEDDALKSSDFVKVFGSGDKQGRIIFFDAFPRTQPMIKMDIINPMDEDKIINFLTVENTTFEFFIASKEKIDESFITLFKEALREHGIGAKTAVGYGYLEENK
ncbi:MAG: type III-B CRISPR module RAMP protein Cmr6 [Epsilonproteobacteria bacterium]|nr:type III-B CRISPR module RAMP protein Cmr6 [Campylobacterota bacterium]